MKISLISKRFFAGVAAVLLSAAGLAACDRDAGEYGEFDRWDTDRDGFVTETEWNGAYQRWDRDRDGRLMETEFGDD